MDVIKEYSGTGIDNDRDGYDDLRTITHLVSDNNWW